MYLVRVKQDIQTRADLEWLVSHFYQQLMSDEVVGFYFTEIVPINLEADRIASARM